MSVRVVAVLTLIAVAVAAVVVVVTGLFRMRQVPSCSSICKSGFLFTRAFFSSFPRVRVTTLHVYASRSLSLAHSPTADSTLMNACAHARAVCVRAV